MWYDHPPWWMFIVFAVMAFSGLLGLMGGASPRWLIPVVAGFAVIVLYSMGHPGPS